MEYTEKLKHMLFGSVNYERIWESKRTAKKKTKQKALNLIAIIARLDSKFCKVGEGRLEKTKGSNAIYDTRRKIGNSAQGLKMSVEVGESLLLTL